MGRFPLGRQGRGVILFDGRWVTLASLYPDATNTTAVYYYHGNPYSNPHPPGLVYGCKLHGVEVLLQVLNI